MIYIYIIHTFIVCPKNNGFFIRQIITLSVPILTYDFHGLPLYSFCNIESCFYHQHCQSISNPTLRDPLETLLQKKKIYIYIYNIY